LAAQFFRSPAIFTFFMNFRRKIPNAVFLLIANGENKCDETESQRCKEESQIFVCSSRESSTV
jgi:hypothetical protein